MAGSRRAKSSLDPTSFHYDSYTQIYPEPVCTFDSDMLIVRHNELLHVIDVIKVSIVTLYFREKIWLM